MFSYILTINYYFVFEQCFDSTRYLTYTEWTTLYGGKKEGSEKGNFRRLPFDHCCVSLQPFEKPCCDQEGNIFDFQAIIGYLKKYKHNPVTGKVRISRWWIYSTFICGGMLHAYCILQPLDLKKLVTLNFTKNQKGEYHCPVLYKVFTNQSHIVVNSKSGNVFSYEVSPTRVIYLLLT